MTKQQAVTAPAGLFQSGATCPYCQEQIEQGQLITACPQCGGLHHDSCWRLKAGCASYHCDPTVHVELSNRAPEIRISLDDIARAPTPQPHSRPAPQDVARAWEPPAPTRSSGMARAAVICAALAGCGLLLGAMGKTSMLVISAAAALAGLVTGVLALVNIGFQQRMRGSGAAGIGIAVSAAVLLTSLVLLGGLARTNRRNIRRQFYAIESRPTDEQLSRMSPAKANALRANVLISTEGGLGLSGAFGSGVVAHRDGDTVYILTNQHVIETADAGETTVLFYSGEESRATVEWVADDDVDVAVLRCQALTMEDYRPIRLSEELLGQSERVFAVGNPMGYTWSYTEGIISGVRQDAKGVTYYQTQTPINSGNSGGGLYGEDGTLIGLNTWTQDKSVAEGLNFALATTTILRLMPVAQRKRLLSGAEAGEH